jgi:YVTN family beta-propeller protein
VPRVFTLAATLLTVTASADTLVVLNKAEASASLIDLATGEEKGRLPTGAGPHEAATAPDGRRVLVANYGAREPGSSLTLLDVAAAKVLKTIDLLPHTRPHGLEWIDARRAAVTAEGSRSLLIVDVEAGSVLRAIPTEQDVSHMVVLTPDRRRAFVANIGSGSVTAVDLEAGERLRSIATGAGAEGLAISPDGSRVYVTNRSADTVTVLDAAGLEIVGSAATASFPIRARLTLDGRLLLVSNARSGDVAVLDAATLREQTRIPMAEKPVATAGRVFGGQFGESPVPVGILVHPDGKRAFVANTNADVVTVLDLEKLAVAGRLRAGKEPDGMAYAPVAPGGL